MTIDADAWLERATDEAPTMVHATVTIRAVPDLLQAVQAVRQTTGLPVQAVRTDRLLGPLHVLMAARHARRAHAAGRGRATDLPVEWLLYAACDRQIHRATRKLGIAPGQHAVSFVALAPIAADRLRAAFEQLEPEGLTFAWSAEDAWPDAAARTATTWWDEVLPAGAARRPAIDRVLSAMAVLAVERA